MRRAAVPLIVLALILVAIFRNAILGGIVAAEASHATGTHISFASLQAGLSRAVLQHVQIRAPDGEPLATIRTLIVGYDLRDLLPGGRRKYGLRSIEVVDPDVTIVRHPDGSLNVPIPKLGGGGKGGTPFVFTAVVRDGSASFRNETASEPHGTPVTVSGIDVRLSADTAARTTYAFSAAYDDRGARYPLHGEGFVDAAHPLTLQHIWAPVIPLGDLANALLGTPAVRVTDGALRGLDVHVFGMGAPGTPLHAHVIGGARLTGGRVVLAALTAPVADLAGTFDVTDAAVTTNGIRATLGGMPATLRGGIYDLRHPQARFALTGSAPLSELRRLARAAQHLPNVTGPLAFRLLVEGPALDPAAFVELQSPELLYNGVALSDARALLAATRDGMTIFGAQMHEGDVRVAASGDVAFAKSPAVRLLLGGSAPAASLPFVAAFAPGMTLHAATLATARTLHTIELGGFIAGNTPAETASAVFAVDSHGVGSAGPIFAGNARHWIDARIALDHPHGRIVALAAIHRFPLARAPQVALGNFRIPSIPQIAGTANGDALGVDDRNAVSVRLRNGAFAQRGQTLASGVDATIAMRGRAIRVWSAHGRIAGGEAEAAGSLGGNDAIAFVLSGARLAGIPIATAGSVRMRGGDVRLRDVLVQAGPAIVGAEGTVAATGSHAYAIDARVHALDLHDAAEIASPRLASDVTGSADASLRIAGSGTAPSVAGWIDVPEGSLDGEGFHALRLDVAGGTGGVALEHGTVALGGSAVSFNGTVAPHAGTIAMNAPHLNLADLNDFFDDGDTFAGTGHLRLSLAYGGALATSGDAAFSGARLRAYDLGTARARWSTAGGAVRIAASTNSATGRLRLRGDVGLPSLAAAAAGPQALARETALNLQAEATDVALADWIPSLRVNAPIVGTANASATVRGRYPNLAIAARANVSHAMVGRVPIESLAFAGTVHGTRANVSLLRVQMPYLSAAASGSFGLARSAPLALRASARSSDIGKLATVTTGKKNTIGGAASATASVSGTLRDPSVAGALSIASLRYGRFTLPRVRATLAATRTAISLRRGEADFARGTISARGRIPIGAHGFRLATAPVTAAVTAGDVALENFAPLLPKGTALAGRIDGSIAVAGTVGAPHMSGSLRLTGGAYTGPLDRAPLDGITGTLAIAGNTISLESLRATAGAGTLAGSGRIVVPDFLDPRDARVSLQLAARHATFDAPKYFSGQVDASIRTAYARGTPITVAGNVTVSHARIPVSALYHPSSGGTAPKLPPVAFDLGIRAGPDVRIQNSSVDVGGAGEATLTGTLAAPVMAGAFHATGGTLNFYQLFRIQRADVAFSPSDGLTPYVNAVATTSIANPPTDVTIHVSGPATNMQLGLTSSPNYSRSQILGLLVGMQSFGAVQGIPTPTGTPFTASAAFQRVGFGEANRIFTQSILQPLSTTLGGALGASNLQLYSNIGTGYGTGIGASIVKRIAQHVTMTTSANLGYPRQEMLKFRYVRKNASDVALTIYQQQESFLNSTPPGVEQGPGGLNLQPSAEMIGTASSGVLLTFQRRYWSCGLFHYCLSCSRC